MPLLVWAEYFLPLWELSGNDMLYLSEQAKNKMLYLLGRRQSYTTPLIEFDAFSAAAKQALASGNLGDLPLLVITGSIRHGGRYLSKSDRGKYASDWMMLQKDLLSISSNSYHDVIEGAGHCTLVTQECYASQVANAIFTFIKKH